MILTNEQLRSTFIGTAEIWEKEGKLCPCRFGAHVRDLVYPVGNGYHGAMYHTSGIISRFVTDSETLSFSWSATAGADHSFDVLCDGTMYGHMTCTAAAGKMEVKLAPGEKTVEIYFPHHAPGKIWDVTLADGAAFALAAPRKHKILFIGDSITHGSTSQFASMTYAHQVGRALDAEVINQGIGGEQFNLRAVDDQIEHFKPDLVSVAYGTNDWSYASSYSRMYGGCHGHLARLRAKYPDTPIAVILPLWRLDHDRVTKVGTFEDMRQLIRHAAELYGATVIDGWDLVPHLTGLFADARLHPNHFGFQFYADNLIPHFEKLLKK